MSRVFNPAKAARLDDPERLTYLPLDRVAALLDAPRGAVVVDYGAGTGFYTFALARLRPDLTLVAFDRQPEMLERLRANAEWPALRSRVVPIDAHDVPAYAGRADRVLCVNVLHELDDEHLDEMRDLLVPGGACVAIDWDASADRDVGPHGPHVFDLLRARAYLETRGFAIAEAARLRYQFAVRFAPRAMPSGC